MLVKLIEFATGRKLEDYLREAVSKATPVAVIRQDLNERIFTTIAKNPEVAITNDFRVIGDSNITNWFIKYKLRSKVKRGPKGAKGGR